jgi:hypothetical protein
MILSAQPRATVVLRDLSDTVLPQLHTVASSNRVQIVSETSSEGEAAVTATPSGGCQARAPCAFPLAALEGVPGFETFSR